MPKLIDLQSDALRLDFVLQPGDIQLLHNHQQLHTRAVFAPCISRPVQ